MCGIWAFIQLCKKSGLPNYEQLFVDFMKMKARGPDSTDFQIIKNLSVGFHRLAIMEPLINLILLKMVNEQSYLYVMAKFTILKN